MGYIPVLRLVALNELMHLMSRHNALKSPAEMHALIGIPSYG